MAWRQFRRCSGTRVQWCEGMSRCSAGARLEGGRSIKNAPASGTKLEQRKGDGFGRVPGAVAGQVCNGFHLQRSEADVWDL
jgi:hypothetical protein